jgi:uncharacterized protein (TIGR02246 family)
VSERETARAVAGVAADLVEAFGSGDVDAYFGFFDPDATFVFHGTGRRLGSRQQYRDEWTSWEVQDGFRVRSCRSSDQLVQDLGDVAVFSHSVETRISTTAGEETLQERETIVFRRDGDRWLAVHEHLSPAPPAS